MEDEYTIKTTWKKPNNRKRITAFLEGRISISRDSMHVAADWVLYGLLAMLAPGKDPDAEQLLMDEAIKRQLDLKETLYETTHYRATSSLRE